MKLRFTLLACAIAVLPHAASATYMATCNALINEWKQCIGNNENCATQEAKITTNCKCHVLKGGEWKMVMAAVSEDGVCGDPPIEEEIGEPDPDLPHHTPRNQVGKGG